MATVEEKIKIVYGQPISEIQQTHNVLSDSEFYISKNLTHRVGSLKPSENTDLLNGYDYVDNKLTYQKLSSDIYDRVYSILSANDTPWMDRIQFSTVNHAHDYDWVKIWPDFGKNGKNKTAPIKQACVNVDMINDGVLNDIDICIPYTSVDLGLPKPEYFIGELKFIAVNELSDIPIALSGSIDINDKDFSGWVYPDGRTYAVGRHEFKQAKIAFGGSSLDNQFTVPNITSFFKMQSQNNGKNVKHIEKHPGQNGVLNHTHSLATYEGEDTESLIFLNCDVKIIDGRSPYSVTPNKLTIHEDRLRSDGTTPLIPQVVDTKVNVENYYNIEKKDCEQYIKKYAENFMVAEDKFRKNIVEHMFDTTIKQAIDVETEIKEVALDNGNTTVDYSEANEETTESYPGYNDMPVLIYIGKRK